ncbi:MAG: hypothetical protein A2176_10450 [Spirochaetes bacterium RBG_13_51_14]|nr:MAG: hypothetical protein A2176_10450 [Spirochaetes bacterium RBG_13_51_14]
MLDEYGRDINYLRISVTDKCNLNCTYCRQIGAEAVQPLSKLLTFEQIVIIVREAVAIGIKKVRLTGGEPLMRKGVEWLVKYLSAISGIQYVGITTNGTLLAQKAVILKNNGLSGINVSLDTLDRNTYREITGGGDIHTVLRGIDAARKAGLPVKINMVVSTSQETKIQNMKNFCSSQGLELQLINRFTLGARKNDTHNFDRPLKCADCNRIRLLANGIIKPCLHSNAEYRIDFNNISKSIERAIESKPAQGTACTNRQMFQIGG